MKRVYIRNPQQAKFYTENGHEPIEVKLEDGIWKWVYNKEDVALLFSQWCNKSLQTIGNQSRCKKCTDFVQRLGSD